MKITKRQLGQIILENERREELISVIYDIMMDNRSGDQEEDFAAAKDEMEADGEATTDELDEIQLDDVLQMGGPLTSEQKIMKITESKLRQIIREALLIERREMLDLVTSPYEDLTDINVLANYALNNDMQGALKDPVLRSYIEKNQAQTLVDNSYEYLKYVGDTNQGFLPAPAGWNLDKVYDFVEKFENEAFKSFSRQKGQSHDALPAKKEREIIGKALTMSYVMPDDIKQIEFQIRRSGGKPTNINIENPTMMSNITAREVERQGLTLDDIARVLRDGGAKESKKRPARDYTPPAYD